MRILYVSHGLANRFEDRIEINKELKKHPKLLKYIKNHELGHKKEFDLSHEFKIDYRLMPSLFLFVFSHPKTWIDFLPFRRYKKQWIYDLNLSILYLTLILILILIIKK